MSEDETPPPRLNPGYVLEQLRRAAGRAGAVAAERVEAWGKVLAGLADGSLRVGSRTPVQGLPPWVTLKVLHGGFASGEASAGGPLASHEREWLRDVEVPEGMAERAALNLHFLAGPGEATLRTWLEDGRYRVEAPEEAALLVHRWLRDEGEEEPALALVEELLPFTDRLRFYPLPRGEAPPEGEELCVRTAGELVARLRARPEHPQVEAQREALGIWSPWADAAVDLFLETAENGWPLQRYPEGWAERARSHRSEFQRLAANHHRCEKRSRPRENLAVFAEFLQRATEDPDAMTGRDVGRLRGALRGYQAKHGEPGSERRRSLRAAQARVAALPAHRDLATALAERLAEAPASRGLEDPAAFLAPLTADEAGVAVDIPGPLRARVEGARAGTLEELLEARLIGSAEQMARHLPALTAETVAAGYADPTLGRLVGRTYRAFRDRRSLLLLDLESQVGFHELPWVRAVAVHGRPATESTQATLRRVATLTLRNFPTTPTPNKLVKELRALSRGADLDLLLVEELAADIFMGTFTDLFLRTAQQAGELLEDTLYARYYGLPYDRVRAMRSGEPGRNGKRTCPEFDALCRELAGPPPQGSRRRWSPSANGMIIEQAQLLTTHNLAALHRVADDAVHQRYPEIAQSCFEHVLSRLQLSIEPWVPRLRNIKNAAFTWRQMVFFLAVAGPEATGAFLPQARRTLGEQAPGFALRFAPALRGLEVAHGGAVLSDSEEARRFLGWSQGRPWVMEPAAT